MEPDSPLLRVYQDLVARVLTTVGGAFDSSSASSASTPVGLARRTWRPVPDQLQAIHVTLGFLGQAVFTVVTDPTLSDVGRDEALQRTVRAARADIDAATADVLQRCSAIVAGLRTAAFPSRPAGDVSAQEATLAGIKNDLRMVLDAQPDENAIVETGMQLLGRAIADGDQLATWLLASSHWPEDYLASRGAPIGRRLWDGRVAEVLNGATPPELAETRRVYRLVSDGRTGLPVLDVLFNSTLPPILEQITGWRLSHLSAGQATAPPAPPAPGRGRNPYLG